MPDLERNIQVVIEATRRGQARAAEELTEDLYQLIRQMISLRRVSQPGEPPGMQTGGLRLSYQWEVRTRPRAVEGIVYSEERTQQPVPGGRLVIYAKFLEFGTEHMEPRPHVRPAAAIITARISPTHARHVRVQQAKAVRSLR